MSAASVIGDSGWRARLELAYERRGERTVPSLRRHEGPLRVQKHFEPEPGWCEHVIVHPPAGIAGGDRLEVELAVGADANARLTTPGATRWYRSAGAEASAAVVARVGQGGALEWLPQEQIVFDGAIGCATTRFELAPDATVIAWDVVTLGRRAGDKPFTRGRFGARLEVARAGALVLSDRMLLDADDALRPSAIGWGGAEVLATFIASGPWRVPPAQLVAAAREVAVPGRAGMSVLAGAASMPATIVARLLGDDTAAAHAWLRELWAVVRPGLIGRAPCVPRIWNT